ncbi:MAG: T9SS type A sorting domain-containing protein [Bacteroidetes bacterium]|nr:T9SS type A sorting domain-containing protein [Bacteroidota bacterium]
MQIPTSGDSINSITQINIEHSVAIYPTITNDIVFIQINIPAKVSIKIYDLLGKLIVSQNISSLAENKISLSEYDTGIYIVSVSIDNTIINKKIILTK